MTNIPHLLRATGVIVSSMSESRTGGAIRTAYRFTTGQHLDGIYRTDAGWITRGTRSLDGGRAGRWSLLSRAERAGIRLGSTAAAGGTLWGLQAAPDVTVGTWATLGAAATVGAGYASGNWVCNLRHNWEWVRPLHVALEGPLRLPEGTIPRSYIHIPRDYPGRTEVGRIDLPAAFVGVDGAAATIGNIVKTKLGLSDATVTFKLEGRRPHLMIRQTPRPPARVMFADESVRQLVAAAAESAPLIGIGPKDVRVSVDLDAESPHILVSASTGGGKSVITRTMAAQMLHNGAQAVFLDFKRHSHKWARGLPNVAYCRDIGDIHDALVYLGTEGHRRNIVVDDWEGEGDAPVGPRMAIILEEANATVSKLKRYWAASRKAKGDEFGPADPKESPAIDALREILFMGRAVRMHVFLVAQSATAAALGGPEVRECFATRILARYTRNAWNMLVPEVQPVPRSTRHIGRAQVVLGGVAHETQVVFYSDSEARGWATAGTVAATPDLGGAGTAPARHVTGSGSPLTSEDGAPTSRDSHSVTPVLTLVKDEPQTPPRPSAPPQVARYSLAAAAREGIVPLSADALRQAKRRDPEFPAGDGGKWTAEELQKWHRNRPGVAESA
ncbi:helicase HerA domain-containing protein [[Kitasatospora] papulosa]|uniref:helicase HerA domain-containing protein n=1 Tax=[Kitasatospora] papulosa TaxID=1464011 RepID=UPI00371F5A36